MYVHLQVNGSQENPQQGVQPDILCFIRYRRYVGKTISS